MSLETVPLRRCAIAAALALATLPLLAAEGLAPGETDVCAVLPGAEVAAALGGSLKETRPFRDPEGHYSRCAYLLSSTAGGKEVPAGYVLHLYPDADYDELLAVHEGDYEQVQGLGDAAILFQDEDQRWKLRFVRRGRYCAEATAADPESARKLARLAFEQL